MYFYDLCISEFPGTRNIGYLWLSVFFMSGNLKMFSDLFGFACDLFTHPSEKLSALAVIIKNAVQSEVVTLQLFFLSQTN